MRQTTKQNKHKTHIQQQHTIKQQSKTKNKEYTHTTPHIHRNIINNKHMKTTKQTIRHQQYKNSNKQIQTHIHTHSQNKNKHTHNNKHTHTQTHTQTTTTNQTQTHTFKT